MNGPLPALNALRVKSAPPASTVFCDSIIPERSTRTDRNGADGVLRSTFRVDASTAVTVSTGASSPSRSDSFVFRYRSRFHFADAASNVAPSWYFTSVRKVNVYVLPSGEIVHFVASHGMISPFGVTRTSESYIAYMRCRSTKRPDSIGSMLLMSEFIANVTLPPYAALAPPGACHVRADVAPVHAPSTKASTARIAIMREKLRAMRNTPQTFLRSGGGYVRSDRPVQDCQGFRGTGRRASCARSPSVRRAARRPCGRRSAGAGSAGSRGRRPDRRVAGGPPPAGTGSERGGRPARPRRSRSGC